MDKHFELQLSIYFISVMAEEVLEKLKEQLNCSICLDTYADPKLLQCFHVYCRKCLVPLVVRDEQGELGLTCPTCRQVTPIPAGGVAGLQSAFHINRFLEIRRKNWRIQQPLQMEVPQWMHLQGMLLDTVLSILRRN